LASKPPTYTHPRVVPPSMFRIFGESGSSPFSAGERAAVQRLADFRAGLLIDGIVTDVKSEVGYAACAAYLSCIEAVSHTLGLRPSPRSYRKTFTANYRALFPDGDRRYRVDVLEASVDQQFDIWVNGQKFELDADAIERAQRLQRSWLSLIKALDHWTQSDNKQVGRADLVSALVELDIAWACFESSYIGALIAIEEQARQLVVQAAELERQLAPNPHDQPLCVEAERTFVDCMAHLNSIANHKGKGRQDLRADILERAREVLRGGVVRRGQEAAKILAKDVVASYAAMRAYMRKVSECFEHVDPHLCNNVGLVARLVDYEESWEVGSRYVRQDDMLHAICDIFGEIRQAEELAPELSAMVEDCDVELFMVLPRLVVLAFLANPRGDRADLVRMLLPHRFGPKGDNALVKVDPELKALYIRYKDTAHLLAGKVEGGIAEAKAVLVRQAVLGDIDLPSTMLGAGGAEAGLVRRAARELLLAVETVSLELQRHCPEDWNQCSAVLVHCLMPGDCAPKELGKFQV